MKVSINNLDKIIIICVIITALTGYVVSAMLISHQEWAVVIELDGKVYGRYTAREEKEIVIQSKYGRNVVMLTKNGAYMKEANCKDKLDVLQGEITRPGQIIICLPNHMSIRIEGEKGFDALSY